MLGLLVISLFYTGDTNLSRKIFAVSIIAFVQLQLMYYTSTISAVEQKDDFYKLMIELSKIKIMTHSIKYKEKIEKEELLFSILDKPNLEGELSEYISKQQITTEFIKNQRVEHSIRQIFTLIVVLCSLFVVLI